METRTRNIKKNLITGIGFLMTAALLSGCGGGGGDAIDDPDVGASVSTESRRIFLPDSVEVNKQASGDFDGAMVAAGRAALASEPDDEVVLGDRDVTGFVAQVNAQNEATTVDAVAEDVDDRLNGGYGDFNPSRVTLISREEQDGGDAIFTIYRLDLYNALTPTDLGNALVQLLGVRTAEGVLENLPDSLDNETAHATYMLYLTLAYCSTTDVYISAAVSANELADSYQPVLTGVTSYTNQGDVNAQVHSHEMSKTAEGGGGQADFLFVIDNSGSMSDEQEAISQASTDFETAMAGSGLDYSMAVITTDSDELRDSNADGGFTSSIEEFQTDVVVGSRGNGYSESGIWFGEQALLPEGSVAEDGFPRQGASLSVVIMSDEVDQYASHSSEGDFDVNYNLFYENGYRVYTIVDTDPTSWNYGQTYIDLAKATGGSYASIDDLSAFEEIMTQIANNAGGASSIYQLDYYPLTGSIVVTVNGTPVQNHAHNGWTYNIGSNAIVFHGEAIPADGQTVTIAYNYL
ncbi:uncharacterized protein Dvar_10840 [Desulfosarcina variabilis str. Montpellier]|uniref:hypothetical protein n=1 Tax=Desulfosarcina variabilis TaxID=2300 RepID=UPI003AFA254E